MCEAYKIIQELVDDLYLSKETWEKITLNKKKLDELDYISDRVEKFKSTLNSIVETRTFNPIEELNKTANEIFKEPTDVCDLENTLDGLLYFLRNISITNCDLEKLACDLQTYKDRIHNNPIGSFDVTNFLDSLGNFIKDLNYIANGGTGDTFSLGLFQNDLIHQLKSLFTNRDYTPEGEKELSFNSQLVELRTQLRFLLNTRLTHLLIGLRDENISDGIVKQRIERVINEIDKILTTPVFESYCVRDIMVTLREERETLSNYINKLPLPKEGILRLRNNEILKGAMEVYAVIEFLAEVILRKVILDRTGINKEAIETLHSKLDDIIHFITHHFKEDYTEVTRANIRDRANKLIRELSESNIKNGFYKQLHNLIIENLKEVINHIPEDCKGDYSVVIDYVARAQNDVNYFDKGFNYYSEKKLYCFNDLLQAKERIVKYVESQCVEYFTKDVYIATLKRMLEDFKAEILKNIDCCYIDTTTYMKIELWPLYKQIRKTIAHLDLNEVKGDDIIKCLENADEVISRLTSDENNTGEVNAESELNLFIKQTKGDQ